MKTEVLILLCIIEILKVIEKWNDLKKNNNHCEKRKTKLLSHLSYLNTWLKDLSSASKEKDLNNRRRENCLIQSSCNKELQSKQRKNGVYDNGDSPTKPPNNDECHNNSKKYVENVKKFRKSNSVLIDKAKYLYLYLFYDLNHVHRNLAGNSYLQIKWLCVQKRTTHLIVIIKFKRR